jgi:hypothetical protein
MSLIEAWDPDGLAPATAAQGVVDTADPERIS